MMHTLFTILVVFFTIPTLAQHKASLKIVGETLNFEILGITNWNYSLKPSKASNQTKVVLKVDGLKPEVFAEIKNMVNPFVEEIIFTAKGMDNKPELAFILKNSNVEAFDYLTDDPPRLVIDFYENQSKKIGNAVVNDKSGINKSKLTKNQDQSSALDKKRKQNKNRAPAQFEMFSADNINNVEFNPLTSDQASLKSGLFDGGDLTFSRFKVKDFEIDQNQIIKGLNNYYLQFPMLEQEFSFWTEMKINTPQYEIQRADSQEYKDFRLIRSLYAKNRPLVLEKSLAWFEHNHSQSPYLEVGHLMVADRLLQFGKAENNQTIVKRAIDRYQEFVDLYPKSLLAERTSLMLGFLHIDKKDYFSAIRTFQKHVLNPETQDRKSRNFARLGQAFALSRMNRLEDALNILDTIKQNSPDEKIKAEVEFSKADFYMRASNYDMALKSYAAVLKSNDYLKKNYPNAIFNQMEALFRSKKPIEAHQAALDFVQKFPSHEYAPYALTRLGELLEILVKDQKKSVGAFLETHFRFGDSPKTIVARLHLLSARMKGMKELELNETIKKMDELTKKSDLENIDQFKVTMIGDGFARRNDFNKAIEISEKFYQQSPNRVNSEQVTTRIVRYANEMIRNLSESGNHKAVLQKVRQYSYTWLKNRDRIDTDFAVANAYLAAGAYQVANDKLESVKNRINALGSSQKDLTIRAIQAIPSVEKVMLSQALAFSELGRNKEAYDALNAIKKIDQLSIRDQIDRIYLASKIYERRGDPETAIRFLNEAIANWKNEKVYIVPSQIRLAQLEVDRKNYSTALEILTSTLTTEMKDVEKIKLLRVKADVAIKANETGVAISTLQELISQFSTSGQLPEERYKLGLLLYDSGDIKTAEKVLLGFQGESTWQKLASEKLQGQSWQSDHKKYFKRLPAATQAVVNEAKNDNK